LIGAGRVDMFIIESNQNIFVLVYLLYGYTNGDGCIANAARTDEIIGLICNDMGLQPKGPKILTGDVNASVSKLPH
jgi:hypothetical protein